MNCKTLEFSARICGIGKILTFDVPIEKGAAITNRFCPQELLTGGAFTNLPDLITAVNGESLDEFISDCNMQVIGMITSSPNDTEMDAHFGGLMAAIMSHMRHCGRLIFGDLLIYVDCFSYLLLADGFSEEEIKDIYPRITKTIVDFYPDSVKDSINLTPLKETPLYRILSNIVNKTYSN